MDVYADMGCIMKVNVHCEACKMKMMEVLGSICGVYSVTIDAEAGTAKVSGEVDPNILLRALATSGEHAEVVWVKLKHPSLNSNNNHGYGRYNRSLPQNPMYHPIQQQRRPAVQYPAHFTNYAYAGSHLPPRRPPTYYDGYYR